jgi:uncharacterized protein (TIRG00374 family)
LTFVSGFAFTLTPGKVGEMMRARYYKDSGIPLSRVAAAFFVERLTDLLAMVALALTAFAASSDYRRLLWGSVIGMTIILILLAILPWNRIQAALEAHSNLPKVLKNALLGAIRAFTSARVLLSPPMLVIGFVLGVIAWGLEGVGLQVISTMIPMVSLDYVSAIGIYAVAIIVGALSFLPGGLGTTEAAMVALLATHGYSMPDAILLTIICRVLTLWFAVALGWVAGLALQARPAQTKTTAKGTAFSASRGMFAPASAGNGNRDMDQYRDVPLSSVEPARPPQSDVAQLNGHSLHQPPAMRINSESFEAINNGVKAHPLCVDLDGTLIHSDLLLESFLLLVKRNVLYVCLIPFWLMRGKAALKAEIARRVTLKPNALPYHQEFSKWLEAEKEGGRSIWLCTAANQLLAQSVAAHVGFFDGVLASDDTRNLSGRNKARCLLEKFGPQGFDYCGNHRVDLAIWQHARGAVVVNGRPSLQKKAESASQLLTVFPARTKPLKAIVKALRPHQWAKNVLIFLPLLAAHKMHDLGALTASVLAFLSFSLCASSVYLLNDMLDLEADRQHPRKSKRPFAAGDLSLVAGFALAPSLLIIAICIAILLPLQFQLVLGAYYAFTIAYSFGLKRLVLIDALSLAGLYTLRIVAGAAATGISLSFWLLLFSVFLFLSLALVKRYSELESMRRAGKLSAAGRGYHVEDLPILQSLGSAAGYLSVLVLALYICITQKLKSLFK